VVNFNRFENIAGISAIWDLNKVVFSFQLRSHHVHCRQPPAVQRADYSNPKTSAIRPTRFRLRHLQCHLHFITGLEAAASMRN